MITFDVPDMTCGHCVRTLERALREVDPAARLDVDLAARQVRVHEGKAPASAFAAAIERAGYTARPVPTAPALPLPMLACCGGGCGCGCR